uniref:Ig-like domain-containing protein n=1 Tax=Timema douglasi TaxID=61478 RepID=A0A7R8VD84_TIMDO|nr:unnamed protein product [Timema douglasi]
MAVELGSALHLNCRVAMLQDKTVMWLKKGVDRVRLLTVGLMPYSSDPRVGVSFQYPNNWRLFINPVSRDDGGVYVCQVSTHPPRTLTTNLTVLAPNIEIVDEQGHEVKDRYYKTGSTIDLTCKMSIRREGSVLAWGIDNRPIISSPRSELRPGSMSSRLVIHGATKRDSGTYSCSISTHAFIHANVYVLNGETQAAVQQETGDSGGSTSSHQNDILVALVMSVFTARVIAL